MLGASSLLCIVGGGISAEYLTLKAINEIMSADKVYIDTYTSIAPGIDEELVSRLNPRAEIVKASRKQLEDYSWKLIGEALDKRIVVLVPGDAFTATTHIAIRVEAAKRGVKVCFVNGVSGLQAVMNTLGLQVYRFGKPVTLVYPEAFKPYSVVEVVRDNLARNLHTLVLLDLRLEEGVAMTINEAVEILLDLDNEYSLENNSEPVLRSVKAAGVARAGLLDEKCVVGSLESLARASFPPPPHTLVVLAKRLHPLEEESLQLSCMPASRE